jgi:hypothetical protein
LFIENDNSQKAKIRNKAKGISVKLGELETAIVDFGGGGGCIESNEHNKQETAECGYWYAHCYRAIQLCIINLIEKNTKEFRQFSWKGDTFV